MNDYFFDDIRDLVSHLLTLNPKISPIKLQKSLYFLFAFYGATYGSINREEIKGMKAETEETYPPYLFRDQFSAWKYGPVLESVYRDFKNDNYEPNPINLEEYDFDVILYLEELFKQINSTSDFTLVERSHMDMAWQTVYQRSGGFINPEMDHDEIINEYREKLSK